MIKLIDGMVTKEQFEKVNQSVRDELELLSTFVGKDIFVSSAFREGDKAQHGKGLAVDVICPDLPLMDFYFAASRFLFNGIGVYPGWKYAGKIEGGLHLDQRQGVSHRALWMGVKETPESPQKYVDLSLQNLKKYGAL